MNIFFYILCFAFLGILFVLLSGIFNFIGAVILKQTNRFKKNIGLDERNNENDKK